MTKLEIFDEITSIMKYDSSTCKDLKDSFVYIFAMLPKVTTIGRPTMGIQDYSNVMFVSFDEYNFVYPTSRLLSLDQGHGMTGRGVMVEHYIPWTPEHITKNVNLDYCLSLISKEK